MAVGFFPPHCCHVSWATVVEPVKTCCSITQRCCSCYLYLLEVHR